jgi:hypothetical protein
MHLINQIAFVHAVPFAWTLFLPTLWTPSHFSSLLSYCFFQHTGPTPSNPDSKASPAPVRPPDSTCHTLLSSPLHLSFFLAHLWIWGHRSQLSPLPFQGILPWALLWLSLWTVTLKHFECISSLQPWNAAPTAFALFGKWGNWGSGTVNSLPHVTKSPGLNSGDPGLPLCTSS